MRPIQRFLAVARNVASAIVSQITPASQDTSGTLASKTFSACSLTVTGASSVTYNWTFDTISGGAWSVNSGQGTNSAVARVTSALADDYSTAEFTCTVVADGVTFTRTCTLSYYRDTSGGVGATMTL